MKRRAPTRRPPPKSVTRSTLTTRSSHSTVRRSSLNVFAKPPLPFSPAARPPKAQHGTRQIAHIVHEPEPSLIDLIDNLLAKGVMLNADLILALANVDLVYIRLSALLCAADRVLPRRAR